MKEKFLAWWRQPRESYEWHELLLCGLLAAYGGFILVLGLFLSGDFPHGRWPVVVLGVWTILMAVLLAFVVFPWFHRKVDQLIDKLRGSR